MKNINEIDGVELYFEEEKFKDSKYVYIYILDTIEYLD